MKKTVKVFSLALAIITLMISICSCGAIKTFFMREEERADFLFAEAEKQFDPDKNHCTFYITVNVDYDGRKYSRDLVYSEYYDGKDSKNVKYKLIQQTNEIDGVATSYIYTNGNLYISSIEGSFVADFDNFEQASYYIPFHKVYYDTVSYAFLSCPVIDNGEYKIFLTHTSTESKANMYKYLYWAIPSSIYNKMYACQFVDEYTFDKKFRMTEYKTSVDLKPINSSEKGSVTVSFRQVYHYEDFTISPPKDADKYGHLVDPI